MTDKDPLRPELWTERSVDQTREVYRDWAATYDTDVTARGYRTPARIAAALKTILTRPDIRVLDFGCGTGISGAALKSVGIGSIDGTDITQEMVDLARDKDIYNTLWVGKPGQVPAAAGTYGAIVAAGVISLGAAPPQTLDLLVRALTSGGILALSFNDPTLVDGRYDAALTQQITDGRLRALFREHGPHLDDMQMGSDVIILERL
jgi:predicted TPR repeat methyltransferase